MRKHYASSHWMNNEESASPRNIMSTIGHAGKSIGYGAGAVATPLMSNAHLWSQARAEPIFVPPAYASMASISSLHSPRISGVHVREKWLREQARLNNSAGPYVNTSVPTGGASSSSMYTHPALMKSMYADNMAHSNKLASMTPTLCHDEFSSIPKYMQKTSSLSSPSALVRYNNNRNPYALDEMAYRDYSSSVYDAEDVTKQYTRQMNAQKALHQLELSQLANSNAMVRTVNNVYNPSHSYEPKYSLSRPETPSQVGQYGTAYSSKHASVEAAVKRACEMHKKALDKLALERGHMNMSSLSLSPPHSNSYKQPSTNTHISAYARAMQAQRDLYKSLPNASKKTESHARTFSSLTPGMRPVQSRSNDWTVRPKNEHASIIHRDPFVVR